MQEIDEKTTIEKLADSLIKKSSVDVSSFDDVKYIVEELVERGILELDDGYITLKKF